MLSCTLQVASILFFLVFFHCCNNLCIHLVLLKSSQMIHILSRSCSTFPFFRRPKNVSIMQLSMQLPRLDIDWIIPCFLVPDDSSYVDIAILDLNEILIL